MKIERNNQNNIIQRKDLDPNGFNLAGENHAESNTRRDKERGYAVNKGLGYYTESEYQYIEGGKQVVGDSIMLRLEHLLHIQDTKYKIWLVQFSQGGVPDFYSNSDDITEAWKNFLQSYKKSIDEIMAQTRIIDEDTDESSVYREKLLSFYNIVNRSSELCSKIINNQIYSVGSFFKTIISWKNPNDIMMYNASSLLDELNEFISYFKSNVINRNINNNISNERSIRMNNIANKNYNKKVLWKVGNDHIKDIKKINGNINYNILAKDEFNEGYSTYLSDRETKNDDYPNGYDIPELQSEIP